MIALSTGVITHFCVSKNKAVQVGETFSIDAQASGTIAVDGEQEIHYRKNDLLKSLIVRCGPHKADVLQIVKLVKKRGFFTTVRQD